jgi:hypothetical protein
MAYPLNTQFRVEPAGEKFLLIAIWFGSPTQMHGMRQQVQDLVGTYDSEDEANTVANVLQQTAQVEHDELVELADLAGFVPENGHDH